MMSDYPAGFVTCLHIRSSHEVLVAPQPPVRPPLLDPCLVIPFVPPNVTVNASRASVYISVEMNASNATLNESRRGPDPEAREHTLLHAENGCCTS